MLPALRGQSNASWVRSGAGIAATYSSTANQPSLRQSRTSGYTTAQQMVRANSRRVFETPDQNQFRAVAVNGCCQTRRGPKLEASSSPLTCVNECAPEEIRTPNLLIRSQMLYPLSYGR